MNTHQAIRAEHMASEQHEFAWAIETNAPEGDRFIPQEYFGHQSPPFSTGVKLATFATRDIARQHLPEVKTWFPDAKVVRIELLIETP